MTTSVCMGTYNGEKYIYKQLKSIYIQTKKPDEVIICDDGSIDETVNIIRTFIKKYKLEKSWFLYVNERNKGYPKNVYDAMSIWSKENVFVADQDDIWYKDKMGRRGKKWVLKK